MIGDSVDVAGIARRNWRLYGTFLAGIIAAVWVTWYLAGRKHDPKIAQNVEQQQPYVPQTRLDFGKPTRTYEPPEEKKAEPVKEEPRSGSRPPENRMQEQRQRIQKAAAAAKDPTLGDLFGGDTDAETMRYFDTTGKGRAGRDGGQIAGGGAKQGNVPQGLADGYPTLIPEEDRQGLVSQKAAWSAGVGKNDDFVVKSKYQQSLGPGLVQAGKAVIRGQASRAINSDIPGDFFAEIIDPVCDSPTGTQLLIPAGTFLQGTYNPQLSYGQSRLQVSGAVLRFENGDYQPIEGMNAYGPDGEPGLPADVDRHPWQLAGSIAGAAVLSIVGQAGQLLAGDSNEPDVVVMGAQGASSQSRSIGNEIIQRELRRPNTLRYHVGDIIEVVVDKDFVLPARGYCQ